MIRDVHPRSGSRIRILIFYPSRIQGSKKGTGSRIPGSATLVPGRAFYMYRCKNQGHNMSDSQCRTIVAVVLGSIPAYSDTVESEGAADETLLNTVHKKSPFILCRQLTRNNTPPHPSQRGGIEPGWWKGGWLLST